MTLFVVYLLCLVFYLFGNQFNFTSKIRYNDGTTYFVKRGSSFFFWLIFFVLTFISAFRQGFVDTNTYRNIYTSVGTNFSMVLSDDLRVESGFKFICYLLNFVSNNSQILLIVISILINFSIFKMIDKYSENRFFSSFIYLCSIYLTTMNTIRQYMVVAVLILSIPLLIKQKKIVFMGIVLALSTIHSTSIFAGLIMIICCDKFINKKMIILVGLLLILAILPSDTFFNILKTAEIKDYSDMYQDLNKSGVSILRLLVQVIPVLLSLIYYLFGIFKKNKEISLEYSFFMNLNIINMIIYILATKNNYLARLSIYFEFVSILTIPFLIRKLIKKDQIYIANLITIVLYSIYFYFAVSAFGNNSIAALRPIFLGGN